MLEKNQFSERVEKGFENLLNQQTLVRLQSSKVIQKWISFYKEWFNVSVDLNQFEELLEPQGPGWSTIVLPKEITLEMCTSLLSKKIKHFECHLGNKVIKKLRWKETSYITYERGGPSTLLELLVCDLFLLFQNKEITGKNPRNMFKSHGSYTENHQQIHVTATINLPWKKDAFGNYTIPPMYKLSKLEYKIWC